MLGMKKKQESNEDTQNISTEEKVEQLEAKEIEIEEEIEKIKEKSEEKVEVKEETKVPEDDDDFDDEYDDEDDSPLQYKRREEEKEESSEESPKEPSKAKVEDEEPQEQLNRFLLELDTRVSRIESILFRLTQNGKQ